MDTHDVASIIGNALLLWVIAELRGIRKTARRHGERLARLEERVRNVTAPLLCLALLTLCGCAALGSAALGLAGGAIVGGPPGALVGGLGGLLGWLVTSIANGYESFLQPHNPTPPPTAAAEAWIFGRWLCLAFVVWLLVHAVTPARIGAIVRNTAQAARTLLRRRPPG
jgi:hypothetical protein